MAEFEVKCECGKDVEADFHVSGRNVVLQVALCEDCRIVAKDEGYKEREDEG